MQDEFNQKKHTVFLANRQEAEISGVSDVRTFNEEEIHAVTDFGELLIKGSALQVQALDVDSGVLKISGNIAALVYTNKSVKKSLLGGLFS